MKKRNKKNPEHFAPGQIRGFNLGSTNVLQKNRRSKNSPEILYLRELYLKNHRKKYPSLPEYARVPYSYTDRTSNGLTKCVIDWLKFNGYHAERISVSGRYLDGTKIISDVLGHKRKIGSGKWIKTSMQPGTADISATINGKSVKVEIKMPGDRQSEIQRKYQAEVEKAGGEYWLIHSFSEFISLYNNIIKNEKV